MSTMLLKMGFKEKFIKWIKACIGNPYFSNLVSGHPSNTINSLKGLRQGDSLLPMLFVIAMEGLTTILENVEIEGHIKGLGKKSI